MAHEDHTTTEVLDPVCGMTISPEDAVGHAELPRPHVLLL